ncbi:MAG TPA: ATP-binding cassette domain-containing protein [Candidatus Angelobacter sp.]
MAPLVDMANVVVVRSRKGPPVLNGISLSLERGEKVAVLGPSGAGKTTLIRAINGFVPLSSGSITVDGIAVQGLHGKQLRRLRSRIAVVSQRHDLVDRLKVYQNVMAGALGRWSSLHALRFLFRPSGKELAEAEQALQRVGIAQKLRERTSDISTGEQQRVAIARALVQHPALLLADEPIASLDPELSDQILSLLCSLADEAGFALLCSLHQPEFAHKYFDQVVRIQHGVVQRLESRPAQSMVVET